ncbi:hypothetical protein N9954_03040 [Maribacter sp.]|nr:hypothetical protein [Maribacter sp.]
MQVIATDLFRLSIPKGFDTIATERVHMRADDTTAPKVNQGPLLSATVYKIKELDTDVYSGKTLQEKFEDSGAYLASTTKRQLDHTKRLATKAYDELVLWGDGQFSLYLFDEHTKNTNPYLENDKVYFAKAGHLNKNALLAYLEKIQNEL